MDFYVQTTKRELTTKKLEAYQKWAEIRQWGLRQPVKFSEYIFGIEFLDFQKTIFMNSWTKRYVLWAVSRNGGKSFMQAPLVMSKQLLIPNFTTYFLSGSHEQSINTIKKIEDIAKKRITSLTGLTDVFDSEIVRNVANTSGFSHLPSGWRYTLYNDSHGRSLSSDYDRNRGYRSSLNVYDECAFLDERLITNTLPFLTQDSSFALGKNTNIEIEPIKMPNQALLCSSAGDMDKYFYKAYKKWGQQMIMGNKDYYVADINADVVLHPFYNGKPYAKALLTQEVIDDAMRQNKTKAMREYYNKFDSVGGDNQPFKRGTIINNSEFRLPILFNNGCEKDVLWGLFYDPARKADNSICLICKYYRDKNVGWKMDLVNCISFADIFKKDRTPCQVTTQLAKIKELLVKYNGEGYAEWQNIILMIDSGAGGGGQFYADFLCEDFTTRDGTKHRGLIDNVEMKEYTSKFPNAYPALRLMSPPKWKVTMFNNALEMFNLNLISFTESYDGKGFITVMENDKNNKEEQVAKTYELSFEEELALRNIDLLKEELIAMCRYENPNGGVRWDIAEDKKWTTSGYDDRSYCFAMAGHYLWELRHKDTIQRNENKTNLLSAPSCISTIDF
jgi:hypothetical protein